MSEVWERIQRTMELAPLPATLLNFHPWTLTPQGPHHFARVIPACVIGEPYSRYVLNEPRIDIADRGAKWKPSEIWPIQLLRDILGQYDPRHGGIVVFKGSQLPAYDSLLSRVSTAASSFSKD